MMWIFLFVDKTDLSEIQGTILIMMRFPHLQVLERFDWKIWDHKIGHANIRIVVARFMAQCQNTSSSLKIGFKTRTMAHEAMRNPRNTTNLRSRLQAELKVLKAGHEDIVEDFGTLEVEVTDTRGWQEQLNYYFLLQNVMSYIPLYKSSKPCFLPECFSKFSQVMRHDVMYRLRYSRSRKHNQRSYVHLLCFATM